METNNIFENAKFGDPYKDKYGNKVFFLGRLDDGSISCLTGNEKSYGFSILESDEIISRWDVPVDDPMSEDDVEEMSETCGNIVGTVGEITMSQVLKAYKAGFNNGCYKNSRP